MKAKKVAAGIVVFVLVIVSVLYGVVEYNYHGHLYEWCMKIHMVQVGLI